VGATRPPLSLSGLRASATRREGALILFDNHAASIGSKSLTPKRGRADRLEARLDAAQERRALHVQRRHILSIGASIFAGPGIADKDRKIGIPVWWGGKDLA